MSHRQLVTDRDIRVIRTRLRILEEMRVAEQAKTNPDEERIQALEDEIDAMIAFIDIETDV